MPLYASLESLSGPPMVFCYCSLGTTLMAFRYYLSGLQTMPLYASLESSSGPPMVFCYCSLGTTLVALRYYLSGLRSIPSCSSLHSSSGPPMVFCYCSLGTTLRALRYYLSGFQFLGLVGYPSDDINKFLWMVRIGGGVFPHIKEPDYLVSCWLLVIWILSMSPLGSYCWCIVGTLVSSFVPFEIPNICLDWQ
ncbi:hypothetical protein AAG906_027369 [Vitis piasezkii]